MARHALACLVLLAAATAKEQTRWSRQISSFTSDLGDWVPLPGPIQREAQTQPQIKRQAVAEPRILSEPVYPGFSRPTGFSQDFPSRTYFNSPTNRQLYLQSLPAVPSAPQNFLSDQGFRFGLSHPTYPLNHGYVGQFPFETVPAVKPRPAPTISNPMTFPKQNLPSPQAKPFINPQQKKNESPKVIDGHRVENISFPSPKKPQSLQKLKYDTFDKVPKTEMVPPRSKSEREEVQLLYVPLESLNRGQFNFRSPLSASAVMNSDSFPPQTIQRQNLPRQTFPRDFQRPIAKPIDSFEQDYFSDFNSQFGAQLDQSTKFSTLSTLFPATLATTPKPNKLKPHQPPLAIFMIQEAGRGDQVRVGDVLASLKNANTVAVLDAVNPQTAPKVFIGPSNLNPPESFAKFELPYLSNIDHSDKKLRTLPFFVAPLSYKTPQGFAKIPFPSPHVGSVIINSQIKETSSTASTPAAVVFPNSYSSTQPQPKLQSVRTQAPVTQKPSFTFYSTAAPKTNPPVPIQTNFYTFEPQTVSTLRPAPPQPKEPQASLNTPSKNSYFLSNDDDQYYPSHINFGPQDTSGIQDTVRTQDPVRAFNIEKQTQPTPTREFNTEKQTEPTTPKTTVSSTSAKSSTYPNELLVTHNPYSINQAFHYSTPDYHSLFEEGYNGPGQQPPSQQLSGPSSVSPTPTTASSTPKPIEQVTEKQQYQTPNYVQNYSPEIHYESEVQSSRYPLTQSSQYTNVPEAVSDYNQPTSPVYNQPLNSANPPTEYSTNVETQSPSYENTDSINKATDVETSPKPQYSYNQYETSYEEEKQQQSSSTTSTTVSPTTRRSSIIKNRGRPRYTTTPRTDSGETSTRYVVTRRPLRERKPLPSRNKYEPNKITTERATRKPIDSSESTTKYSRGRTRGRVHYKASESDDYYPKSRGSSKDNDLAYQRDVLHQNYPVTLMERTSTSDIEAMTEPVPKISSTRNLDSATEVYDTENADTNDNRAISHQLPISTGSKEETYTSRFEPQTEPTYIAKLASTREDLSFQSRSSLAPMDAIPSYEDIVDTEEDLYVKPTTPSQKSEKPDVISYATEPASTATEQNLPSYSINNDYSSAKLEDVPTTPEVEITRNTQETASPSQDEEPEENIVQTTPSYNRVRIRPGVIKQYHQATSAESSRTKPERKRLVQTVTYRPAFNNRRTTMRIEEIEADLKTKQVHVRPEVQDIHRHPVYKPEPTTEPSVTTSSSHETTKRGVFRRRRPTYTTTTTSTEASSTKKPVYEVKSRFRGRRPTEKPTDKPEIETDVSPTQPTSTSRNTLYSRYSTRQRLSERFNKKPEPEDTDDQDSNYSINRPKYAEPESEQWSPKISSDSFKPYNPNDIVEDRKLATTERRLDEDGLDIITARNEFDDILLTVTPATNNRNNKKIPEILPTLEALVEQSKIANNDSTEAMSTFETMLEEVMKSLEEQDENEYSSNVMKHKGGEIGEIPPERIITSGDNYKSTTVEQPETTTIVAGPEESTHAEDEDKSHRRGFWKKVRVRPATESIEAAESQYYPNTANRLGHVITLTKAVHDKTGKYDKPKVTTYKPAFQYIKDIFDTDSELLEVLPTVDIPKLTNKTKNKPTNIFDEVIKSTEAIIKETTEANFIPSEMNLGTGSPDPTLDTIYSTTHSPTEPTTSESSLNVLNKSDGFSLMDYLFGVTSEDDSHLDAKKGELAKTEKIEIEMTTEQPKPKLPTTESTFIPEEITAVPTNDDKTESTEFDIKKVNTTTTKVDKVAETTEKSIKVETSSVSSFMDPNNVMSTSMSTEISHETEICFRGKCIKSKDVL